MDEDLRNDGLLPELSSLRSVYEQLSTLLELSDGRRKKKEKPEFPEDKKHSTNNISRVLINIDLVSSKSLENIFTIFLVFNRNVSQ